MLNSRPLETSIALKAPRTVCGRVSFFTSGFNTRDFEWSTPLPPALGYGSIQSVHLLDGLGFLNNEFLSAGEPFIARIHSPAGPLKLTFILSRGDTSVAFDGDKKPFTVGYGDAVILYAPSAVENGIPPHHRIHNLCITVTPSFLYPIMEELGGLLPPELLRTVEDPRHPYHHACGITPAMRVVLDQIQGGPYSGGLKRLYLEAKVLELISLRMGQMIGAPRRPDLPGRLSPADVDRAMNAEQILIKNLQNPPSLTELARQVALNTTRLKDCFRRVFGTTVFGYLRDKRMEMAGLLLKEGRLSVSEIAQIIGYRSLSHFVTAFHRRFGASPTAYRKRGLIP